MTEDRRKSPVNVDVALGARAELRAELKGEIPQSSMGRLVDALTDAIRPFTEARGLRADQIRLQREDVMIEIARKAQQRLAIEDQSPSAVPPRILVPLMEKASLTDPSDRRLIDTWANVLASASKGVNANHGIYIDILSKLDSLHLRYLEFLAQPDDTNEPPDAFLRFETLDLSSEIENIVDPLLGPIAKQGELEEFAEEISDKINSVFRARGSCLISGGCEHRVKDNLQYIEIFSLRSFEEFPESISGALESLNLIRRVTFTHDRYLNWSMWSNYHVLTIFGLEFFYTGYSGANIIKDEVASFP